MSDLVGNPEDRFSRVAAHIILTITTLISQRLFCWVKVSEFIQVGRAVFCLHDTLGTSVVKNVYLSKSTHIF